MVKIFKKIILNPFLEALENYADLNAFCIDEVFYTYKDLADNISKIRQAITVSGGASKNIGLIANDDIETYASIFAIWLEGLAYVPLSPGSPIERNENIIRQAELKTILNSSESQKIEASGVIYTQKLQFSHINLEPLEVSDQELAYILFTSGTTGQPKGVPITRSNLAGFSTSFDRLGLDILKEDRCLQMFDLTFDLSVMSYLVPLLKGACVYSIPKNKIKYAYIYELMDEYKLNVALMVPSMLHYLRPYFDEMDFPEMKYSLFCGEALPLDITEEWQKCVPNSKIMNVYGPTENTIFCTHYTYDDNNKKVYNGVLSIGKSMFGNKCIIIDSENKRVSKGEKGELCLNGFQLTPGYWKNEEKNKESFFTIYFNGKLERFYKTGDLCSMDNDGDILYLGRLDNQTKIQGFRVELSEIEFHAKEFLNKINVVAVDFKNKINNNEIGLVIESIEFETHELLDALKTQMPQYMIPTQIRFMESFPLNTNGKTDRKALKQIF